MVVCFGIVALVSGCVWNKWGPILTNKPEKNISPHAHGEMAVAEHPEPEPLLEPGRHILKAPKAKKDFLVWAPYDYTPERSWPVIFCYGSSESATPWPFYQVTRGRGFIIVGMTYTMPDSLYHGHGWIHTEREFFEEALELVSSRLNVEPELVFMGGYSKGGYHTSIISEQVLDSLAGLIILGAGRYDIVKNNTAPGTRYLPFASLEGRTYDDYPPSRKDIRGKRIFIGVGQNDVSHNKRARLAVRFYESCGADVTFEEWPGVSDIDVRTNRSEFPSSRMLLNWLRESIEKRKPGYTQQLIEEPPEDSQRTTRAVPYRNMASGTEPINLSGKWKYQPGDNMSWAARDYDDAKWNTMEVPYILPFSKSAGYLWLRKTFFVPAQYEDQKYSLDLGTISVSTQVYLNGGLIAELDQKRRRVLSELPNLVFGWDNVIALRMNLPEGTDVIRWTGEPVFKRTSGWIEVKDFDEEDFAVESYMVYVPRTYTPGRAFPLVIAMPGHPGHPFLNMGGYAELRGYIVACPQSLEAESNYEWLVLIQEELSAILAQMKAKYNIDAKRIYIVGHSKWGFAAYYLGLRNSEIFSGIVSCAGAIGGTKIEMLPRLARVAKEHVPVLIVHGAKDAVIPISRARYMLNELKSLGYECEMLTYPKGGHGVVVDAMENIFDFFDKHSKERIPKLWKILERKRLGKLPTKEVKLIKGVIRRYAQGYSKKDINQVMSCFSREYFSDGMAYSDVRDRISRFFSDNVPIHIKVKDDVKMILNSDDASVIAIVSYNLRYGGETETDEKLWFKFTKVDKDWEIVAGNLLKPEF
jgi:predicted esterase